MTDHRSGFLSYAHDDIRLIRSLHRLLVPRLAIGSKRTITLWNDAQILAGEPWRTSITDAIDAADLGLFALSPAFLHSDFIVKRELPRLLPKLTVPVMLDDVSFTNHQLRGIEELQVFAFLADEWTSPRSYRRTPARRREDFVNRLVDDIHARFDRLDQAQRRTAA